MIHTFSKDQEVAFTSAWWARTVRDEPKLIKFLQKLQQTEIGGFDDYQEYVGRFEMDDRTKKIYQNIADDELKHSGLIIDLLESRGFKSSLDPMPSSYWTEMNSKIVDLETASAVNYFGEALAAFRFEVMIDHVDTPADIKEMLSIILPDEQFHRQTLKRLAGDKLEEFAEYHARAMAALKNSKA